jgi:hypothetical protein
MAEKLAIECLYLDKSDLLTSEAIQRFRYNDLVIFREYNSYNKVKYKVLKSRY